MQMKSNDKKYVMNLKIVDDTVNPLI